MVPTTERLDWEEAVYLAIEIKLEACRSDAQAIVEAQEHTLEVAWKTGLSPDATASLIIEHFTNRK